MFDGCDLQNASNVGVSPPRDSLTVRVRPKDEDSTCVVGVHGTILGVCNQTHEALEVCNRLSIRVGSGGHEVETENRWSGRTPV